MRYLIDTNIIVYMIGDNVTWRNIETLSKLDGTGTPAGTPGTGEDGGPAEGEEGSFG